MDWDDFQKLPTCAVGRHSATPPKAPEKPKPTCVPCAPVPTKSIENYNANEGKEAPTGAKSFARATGTKAKPKVTRYDDGTYRCQNKGCQARFRPEDNHAKACTYHKGTPVFHETLKWWGCCPNSKKMVRARRDYVRRRRRGRARVPGARVSGSLHTGLRRLPGRAGLRVGTPLDWGGRTPTNRGDHLHVRGGL